MKPDSELLAQFARDRAEDAFAELVRRHVNLVYSAALRQVGGDAHLAQDVAQTVFTDLARKASALSRRATLSGWLYTSARFAAANTVRAEQRRRDREERFMREPTETAPEPDWEKLRPVLDEVMHQLKETDREAILLRYFENRPFAEIGLRCGLNENAARMRVERALEKLRALLAKRGVATSIALASVISSHAVQIAPASLAATLASASVAGAGAGTFAFWSTINLTKLKLGLGALVVAGASTVLIMQHQAETNLDAQNQLLTQQIAQLNLDHDNLSNLADQAKKAAALSNDRMKELSRLRAEVGVLQQKTNDLSRLRQQKQELLKAAAAPFETADHLSAQDQFILKQTHASDAVSVLLDAAKEYATKHNGHYPENLEQLLQSGFSWGTHVAAGLGSNDFSFTANDPAHPSQFAVSQRVPIPKPGGSSVVVSGTIAVGGIGSVGIYPVNP